MKNRKGFTLAELLGVLAILAVITVITVPLVNNYIKSSKEKAYNTQLEVIENAAKEWFVVNSTSVDFEENIYFLRINDLKESEFLSSDDIINPKTKEKIKGCVMIEKVGAQYTYNYSVFCSLPTKFAYTGNIQTYNVTSSGEYQIELVGAAGNVGNNYYNYTGYVGGKGASLTFNVELTAGDLLYLIVGGMGNTTTGTYYNGASGAGGGGSFVFRKINAITNSKYQFSKGSDKYEVLGVAAGGNGTCDLSYSSCSGNNGIANPYYSLENYTSYSTYSTTGTTGGVLGIQQFINYNFSLSTYTYNNSVCTGGYGGGGCQSNYQSYGGGWSVYNSSASSFTIGTNVVGKNGVNASNGYIKISKLD